MAEAAAHAVKAAFAALMAGGGMVFVILILIVGIIGGASFIGSSQSSEPLSAEVLAHTQVIQRYASEFGIPEYVSVIQAIMMQESGGRGTDPMQASECPYNQYIGSDPFNKWLKPSCVLVCEDNYSNAHGFPWVYKELKIGKLIGAPVPGTMTAVWWENQIDPSIVFGIPQVGCMDMRGQYAENHQLSPDIEVYNTPEKALAGEDQQLEAAVQEMLKTIGEKK
mgnify:CR=1 FL=1